MFKRDRPPTLSVLAVCCYVVSGCEAVRLTDWVSEYQTEWDEVDGVETRSFADKRVIDSERKGWLTAPLTHKARECTYMRDLSYWKIKGKGLVENMPVKPWGWKCQSQQTLDMTCELFWQEARTAHQHQRRLVSSRRSPMSSDRSLCFVFISIGSQWEGGIRVEVKGKRSSIGLG